MSRLESNAEPSMEEILASIRKIIAEDSSGLRTPAAPARPGTAYAPAQKSSPLSTPAQQPRSGFMSREAFMKSSQPVEPEPASEYHAPVGAPRPASGNFAAGSSSSRSFPRDEARPVEKPSFPNRETSPVTRESEPRWAKENPSARGGARPKEDTLPEEIGPTRSAEKPDQKSEPLVPVRDAAVASETESIEAVAVEAVPVEETATPDEGEAATPDAAGSEVTAPAAATDSDAARIDAQLSELLSEDLNALREGRAAPPTKPAATKPEEDVKAARPAPTPQEKASKSESGKDGADPFVFDLGPSPFAVKSEPQRPDAIASVPAPGSSSPSPFDAPPAAGFDRPSYERGAAPINGSGENSAAKSFERSADFPPRPAAPEPEAASAKSRPTFAIPSVSATLGPSRKLEPLSNAFRELPRSEPVIPTAEAVPEPPRAPEQARIPEPPPAMRGEPDETARTTLPATTTDSGLDRPMEDAVADLLRPLLKTWLAENMPKIVERALRREMSERLLPGQKNPHD